jgi:hypothetical protein
MKRTRLEDGVIGHAVVFDDWWNKKKALCLLVGSGSGPEGESVRIVGNPIRNGGFTVSYVRSYDEGSGNAKGAYQFLSRHFGSPLKAVEIVSEDGIGFHRRLLEQGILASIEVDRNGYDPQTGQFLETPSLVSPLKP